ncbi:MAG: DUF86 domain-containing protein [Nanoarchaeota archaeon]
MKNDLVFINHILDSINAIREFSKNLDKQKLISDRLIQSAIVREIEIIGEAVKNISKDIKNKHLEVKWSEISGTRDKMIHNYFGVDWNIVWDIIKINLPDLESKILNIRKEII